MTTRVFVLLSFLLSSCLTRNELGAQTAPEPDGGRADAGADAASDASTDAALPPAEALERCMLGVWSFCADTTDSSANRSSITFLPRETSIWRTCAAETCRESPARWKVTNIGSDGLGSIAWQFEGAPLPQYFERVACEAEVLRFDSGFAPNARLTRGAEPAPCD